MKSLGCLNPGAAIVGSSKRRHHRAFQLMPYNIFTKTKQPPSVKKIQTVNCTKPHHTAWILHYNSDRSKRETISCCDISKRAA